MSYRRQRLIASIRGGFKDAPPETPGTFRGVRVQRQRAVSGRSRILQPGNRKLAHSADVGLRKSRRKRESRAWNKLASSSQVRSGKNWPVPQLRRLSYGLAGKSRCMLFSGYFSSVSETKRIRQEMKTIMPAMSGRPSLFD